MIKVNKDATTNFESMSVDEIMNEVSSLVTSNKETKDTFLWQLYGTLSVGTLFQATRDIDEVRKYWYECNSFEEFLFEGIDFDNKILLFPAIKEGESIMFLGMTEETYIHEKIERRYGSYRQGHRSTQNVIIKDDRKYPKWIIGEKVVIWPLDLTLFKILAPGTGSKSIDNKDDE